MQVDDRFHPTFLAAIGPDGVPLWQVPAWNISYGAALLRRNLDRLAGDYFAAIAAYNASIGRVLAVQGATLDLPKNSPERRAAFDRLTTGGSYVTSVTEKWRSFQLTPPPEVA